MLIKLKKYNFFKSRLPFQTKFVKAYICSLYIIQEAEAPGERNTFEIRKITLGKKKEKKKDGDN